MLQSSQCLKNSLTETSVIAAARAFCVACDAVVLKIIASLIRQSRQDNITMEVKKLFLTDLTNFCVNSRENRR